MDTPDRRFSVAPMMDWTDRHCRAFHRALTRRALLYTEMVTADAVVHGNRQRLIGFSEIERPLALQLGGADPEKLAAAARIGADFGYDEININVGCPSDRVQSGSFGACLMREPALVARLWQAMQEAAPDVPVTVKCRIGVDDQDPREALFGFVDAVARAGCRVFVVHARKAWLEGLSPRENRDIPALDYGLVRALKRARPDLAIVLNGGLRDLDHGLSEAGAGDGPALDGIMLGRAAYQNPAMLLDVDARLFGERGPASCRIAALEDHLAYVESQLGAGVPLHAMTRHMLGLFNGVPGGRAWRRVLSEQGVRRGAGLEVVREALACVAAASARAA